MLPSTFFDLPFFILLFGVGTVSVSAAHLQAAYARSEYLPAWVARSSIIPLINIPFAWSDLIVGIYGFLILPWYTVLICIAADLIVGGAFDGLFLAAVRRRFGIFAALLISYIIAAIVIIWYFGYAKGFRPITLNTSVYIAIGVLICYKIVGILLARKTE